MNRILSTLISPFIITITFVNTNTNKRVHLERWRVTGRLRNLAVWDGAAWHQPDSLRHYNDIKAWLDTMHVDKEEE